MDENILSYMLYDNTEEKLKALVTISKQEGITSIEYTDTDGKKIEINGNGKQKISMDIKVEAGKDINFKITSNNEEITETISVPSNYINDYINISKSEETSTNTIFNYNVEYNTDLSPEEEVKYYYKLGRDTKTWLENTTGQIRLTMNDVENLENKTTTIMLKQQSKYGDIIIREETVQVPETGDLDVFAHCISKGKTLQEYGFTSSYSNSEDNAFSPYCLKAGHHVDYASWAGNFYLYLDTAGLSKLKASKLYIEYALYGNIKRGYQSTAGFSTNLVYKDGTSQNIARGQSGYASETLIPIEFTLDNAKDINYIQMYISGLDNAYSNSYGYVKNIIFKNVQL